MESPGDRLYGLIYEVTYNDADYLDACQGARLDGTGPYFQFPVEVIGEDGRSHSVFTYKKSPAWGKPPSPAAATWTTSSPVRRRKDCRRLT
ncbi:gamma-glutamylcyclotransferase family protein [Azotobacter vinelandii]